MTKGDNRPPETSLEGWAQLKPGTKESGFCVRLRDTQDLRAFPGRRLPEIMEVHNARQTRAQSCQAFHQYLLDLPPQKESVRSKMILCNFIGMSCP